MSTTFTSTGHAEKILLKLWEQCKKEESCDVIQIASTENSIKRIPAHRLVLSAASKSFYEMFASSTSKSEEIEEDGYILERLVKYCYTGSIVISEEIVVELLITAYKLKLVNVVAACEEFLLEHLDPSNCLGLEVLAEHCCCKTLLEKARCYSLENFSEVCKNSEFLSLSAGQLSLLLASDDLRVGNEEDKFNSLKCWLEYNQSNRKNDFADLFKLVRTEFLEVSFLYDHVESICNSTGCHSLFSKAIKWHASSNSKELSRSKLVKRRKSTQTLMGISQRKSDDKMFIHYYCHQQKAWMEWLKDFEMRRHFCVAVMENYLYIVGGLIVQHNVTQYALNTVIRLNLSTMTLEKMPPLKIPRGGCRAAALNGDLYIMGGCHGGNHFNSVEKWNQQTNKWDVVAPMLTERVFFGSTVFNGKLYAVGGFTLKESSVASAECYDPIQNVWKSIKSMSEARRFPGIAAANGMLYVVGGERSKTVERYDPETNQWTMMRSLRNPISSPDCCTLFRDKVVVCYEDSIEQFDEKDNKWTPIMSLKQPNNIIAIYSYSDKLLTSEFAMN